MKEGRAAEQQKQWDMALIAYSHALAVKPSEEDAIHAMRRCEYFAAFERGQQSEAQQQWRDALAAYRKALCLQPHDQAVAEAINRINERLVANAMNTKTRTPEEGKTTTNLEWSRAALPQPKGSDSAQVAQLIFKKMDGEKISLREIPKTDKDAWDFARMQERVSDDSKKLYHLLGEQLLAADYLLQSEDLAQRQKGLAMAIQAGRGARRLLNDAELASAIADAFLLPNVKDSADEKPYVWLSRGNVIEEAIAAYKLAGDTVRQAAAYQMLLEFAPNRNTADFARVRLAELSQREGNHRRALEYLKEVEPGSGGMSAVRRLIPGIEKKLQLQSNKDGGTP
jgi:tetratricopeptide (TPR) repeat protein